MESSISTRNHHKNGSFSSASRLCNARVFHYILRNKNNQNLRLKSCHVLLSCCTGTRAVVALASTVCTMIVPAALCVSSCWISRLLWYNDLRGVCIVSCTRHVFGCAVDGKYAPWMGSSREVTALCQELLRLIPSKRVVSICTVACCL